MEIATERARTENNGEWLREFLRDNKWRFIYAAFCIFNDAQLAENIFQELTASVRKNINSSSSGGNFLERADTLFLNLCAAHATKGDRRNMRGRGRLILETLDTFPSTYTQIAVLRNVEGLGNVATGERLSLTSSAVRTQFHRVRKALRAALGEIDD